MEIYNWVKVNTYEVLYVMSFDTFKTWKKKQAFLNN